MIKIQNKYNYPILFILLLWICVAIYYWFKISIEPINCGGMMVNAILILLTILLFPLIVTIMAITNKICKLKYKTDFEFVAIPYIMFLIVIGFNFLVETLFH